MPMSDQITAELLFLSPFTILWAAFFAVETARAIAAIRGGRRHG